MSCLVKLMLLQHMLSKQSGVLGDIHYVTKRNASPSSHPLLVRFLCHRELKAKHVNRTLCG